MRAKYCHGHKVKYRISRRLVRAVGALVVIDDLEGRVVINEYSGGFVVKEFKIP